MPCLSANAGGVSQSAFVKNRSYTKFGAIWVPLDTSELNHLRKMVKTKSVKYLPDGGMELYHEEICDPKEGQIQVSGEICGICTWDIATCKMGNKFKFPAPPGHEGIGRIVKVGPGVTGFKEGDRVTGGGFHTLQNMSTQWAYKIPRSDLPGEYWLVEPVSCVITGLDHCRLQAGGQVVVIGCGFMGDRELITIASVLGVSIEELFPKALLDRLKPKKWARRS